VQYAQSDPASLVETAVTVLCSLLMVAPGSWLRRFRTRWSRTV